MRLLVVHHHFRPGGVRRVIELCLPGIVGARPGVTEVVLAGDARPDPDWLSRLSARLAPVPVRFEAEPALGYREEQACGIRRMRGRLRAWLRRVLPENPLEVVVWLHNPGLGRNAVAVGEIAGACRRRGIRAVWHHHDWWFDHRWHRWPELRRTVGGVDGVARTLLPTARGILHAGINREDVALLRAGLGDRAVWWPNPAVPEAPSRGLARRTRVREWLDRRMGLGRAPFWLLPCRFLRRKNIAEAVLLARWLRPEAWVITTAGPSSPAETGAFELLRGAAAAGGWRVSLGVLAGAAEGAPSVQDLLQGCEAVLLTSVLEGFGLPLLEAAAAGRPLVGRRLPNVAPDLSRMGFRFPNLYDEVWVDPGLYQVGAECDRQRRLFGRWRAGLPRAYRRQAGTPARLVAPELTPVPFSRLTLAAQLEVLARPVEESWAACLPLNPWMAGWRSLAARRRLPSLRWPTNLPGGMSPEGYGRRFWRDLARASRDVPVRGDAAPGVQAAFVRQRLRGDRMHPLLWEGGA